MKTFYEKQRTVDGWIYGFVITILSIIIIVWLMPDAQKTITSKFRTILVKNQPLYSNTEIEQRLLDFINNERTANGIRELKLNEELTNVARDHSRYLASINKERSMQDTIKISWYGKNNETIAEKLHNSNIYYWHSVNQNVYAESIVKKYSKLTPNVPTDYLTFEEFLDKIKEHFRNNDQMYNNILNNDYDEIGIGIASDSKDLVYFVTMIFIKRANCGYYPKQCCVEEGYLPYCFEPFYCKNMECNMPE